MARETDAQLQGELQLGAMRALWRLGEPSSVEEVRQSLPTRHRGEPKVSDSYTG